MAPDDTSADAFEIDPVRLSACVRTALLCQLACISCAELCLQDGTLEALRIAKACLACIEACVSLARVAEEPLDTSLVRAALKNCINACSTLEAETRGKPVPGLERHTEVSARFLSRSLEILEPRSPPVNDSALDQGLGAGDPDLGVADVPRSVAREE